MKGVIIVFAFAVFAVVPSESLSPVPCQGLAAPTSIEVNGCSDYPCKFNRKDEVKIEYKFNVPSHTTKLMTVLTAMYGGNSSKKLPNVDGCENIVGTAKCPLEANSEATYKIDRKLEWTHPETDVILEYKLENQDGETIACYNLPINFID